MRQKQAAHAEHGKVLEQKRPLENEAQDVGEDVGRRSEYMQKAREYHDQSDVPLGGLGVVLVLGVGCRDV